MRGLLFAAVLLAGCDGARPPVAAPAAAIDPARVEAEKACSAITGYRPGASDAARAQEYAACVAAVATDVTADAPAPALRGRTDAPD